MGNYPTVGMFTGNPIRIRTFWGTTVPYNRNVHAYLEPYAEPYHFVLRIFEIASISYTLSGTLSGPCWRPHRELGNPVENLGYPGCAPDSWREEVWWWLEDHHSSHSHIDRVGPQELAAKVQISRTAHCCFLEAGCCLSKDASKKNNSTQKYLFSKRQQSISKSTRKWCRPQVLELRNQGRWVEKAIFESPQGLRVAPRA